MSNDGRCNWKSVYNAIKGGCNDAVNNIMLDVFNPNSLIRMSTTPTCQSVTTSDYSIYSNGTVRSCWNYSPLDLYNSSRGNLRYFLSHRLSTCSEYTLYWPMCINSAGNVGPTRLLSVEQSGGGFAEVHVYMFAYVNLHNMPCAASLTEVSCDSTLFSKPIGYPIELKVWMPQFCRLLADSGIINFNEDSIYDVGAYDLKFLSFDPSGLDGYIRASIGGGWC